jgi:hypothetical protein
MADPEVERIRYHTEALKLILVLALAVGGGSFSLLLGPLTLLRTVLATAGIVGMLALAVIGWRQHRYILSLIDALKRDL